MEFFVDTNCYLFYLQRTRYAYTLETRISQQFKVDVATYKKM